MNDITNWIIIVCLIALAVVTYMKNPKIMYSTAVRTAIAYLRKNEGFIVQGVYNLFPSEAKKQITSKNVAIVVEYLLMMVVDTLEESINHESNK
jgi:hypothetical protein